MKRGLSGEYVISLAGGETVKAFTPFPLPPDPPLRMDAGLANNLAEAALELGRLDSLTLISESQLFLYQYVRKEAVLSSRIEGTQSTLDDLLAFEDEQAPGAPIEDVVEVSNYVAALEHGIKRMRGDGFPISNRLLKEIHAVLLSRGRGGDKAPGEFKRSQNWIGGTRPGNAAFVPTSPAETGKCMGALEKFIHTEDGPHPIIKAGLAHVQFETIHPFLDGNGRLGRLLITLMFLAEGVIKEPILYLSLYFKMHREEYYRRLQGVREEGDWEGWLDFYMRGVSMTARDAVAAANKVNSVYQADREKIARAGKDTKAVIQIHEAMMVRQAASPKRLMEMTGLSRPSVTTAFKTLQELGIVSETTGQRRNTRIRYDGTHDVLTREIGAFASGAAS